jgi:uncharacterized protein YjbJ (UPF0337 family)
MSFPDKIANTGQVLKGKAKEAIGKIAADPELEIEGKVDQGKGRRKQAAEKVKNVGKDIFGQ